MLGCILALSLGAGSWIELSAGFPFDGEISDMMILDEGQDYWVGTSEGAMYRSTDGGKTFQLIFNTRDSEPVVVPRLRNKRVVTLSDLGRGIRRDLDPRARSARAEQDADLAGNVRDFPREDSSPLLGSVIRHSARDRLSINQITECSGVVFFITPEMLYRTLDKGIHFELMYTQPSGDLEWVSCDDKTPGRMALRTSNGVLESLHWGESFRAYPNPFPYATGKLLTASLSKGRLKIGVRNEIWYEREDRRGYDLVCRLAGDSVESDQVLYTVGRQRDEMPFVTKDGVLICSEDRIERVPLFGFDRTGMIYFNKEDDYILVSTTRDIYESHDGGESFNHIFSTPTGRDIGWINEEKDGLVLFTAGEIYKQVENRGPPSNAKVRNAPKYSRAPPGEVILRGLDHFGLAPDTVAQRRIDLHLRSWMPRLLVTFSHSDNPALTASTNASTGADRSGSRDREHTVWRAFLFWDLGELLLDSFQTDVAWSDIDELRIRMSYRIQDTYAVWSHSLEQLAQPGLEPKERIYHELRQREASAYLGAITGSRFETFAGGEGIVRPQN